MLCFNIDVMVFYVVMLSYENSVGGSMSCTMLGESLWEGEVGDYHNG